MQKKEQRMMAVFIHTDWCKYCKAMQNTSCKNKKVEVLLNQHPYFIDLNAEEKRSIRFYGHTFHYRPTGNNTGVHELAEQLGIIGGKISFPSLCFLNAKNEIIYQHEGYFDSQVLEKKFWNN
jgi:thioredoxin-related protein